MNREEERFFDDFYNSTSEILIRISYQITHNMEVAEEICHDAYIKLYNRSERIPDQSQLRYWLIRVVKNMSLNYAKRKANERRLYEKVFKEHYQKNETSEEIYLNKESMYMVQYAIAKLPDRLKEVVILIEYGNLSYKEIARVLNITEENVKVRANRARKKLLFILERIGVHVPN